MSGGARRSLRSSTADCTTASLSLAATAASVSFKFKDVVNNSSTSKNKEVKEDKSGKRTHAGQVKISSTSVKSSSLTNGTKASSFLASSSSCSSRVIDVKEETSSKADDSSRPRRDAALRAIIPSAYLSNLTALKLKEEQDLKKAIKASLLEAKRNGVTSVPPTKQTSSSTSNNKTPKEETTDSSSVTKSSNNLNNNHHQNHLHHRKGRNPHPQRKFAHNSSNGSVSSSSTSSLTQYRGLPSYHAPLIPTNEVYPAITPDTQDFVSFLCFRKMPAPVTLPDHLNMDKLNEEAMKEKKKKTEESKKITQDDRSSGKKRKKEVKEDDKNDKTVTNNNTQKKEEKNDKKLRRH